MSENVVKSVSTPTTLDPENWDDVRRLGHQMFDDMVDYLRTVRDRPVWQSPTQEARVALRQPLPRRGTELAAVYEKFKQYVLPHPTSNIHPRFWGWVMGNGTAVGLLSDLLASAMNCHVSGYDQAATLVERRVIKWLAEMVDYPPEASGVLVSGGTVANLLGVTVARNTAASVDIRCLGVEPDKGRLTVYGSVATHGWAARSCDLLGLGGTFLSENSGGWTRSR